MVSPLGQRQMFQTMNVEAVRSASEFSGLLQREAQQQQLTADRMADEHTEVPQIPKTDAMRTEERKGSRQGQGEAGQGGTGDGQPEPDEARDGSANPAETHLDFLA